ncbi:MAG: hypothetical protein CMM76_13565 [Rhodospirillaceae bacterium]|nr:hypothetical protein [Rhodospirillaceae bacterium]
MPRKSRELRLSQATALVAAYEEANFGDDYRARFARDMVGRLGRNKGLSKRQREWLDNLIEEGVPESKGDAALLARITAAQAVEGMSARDIDILKEFSYKINRGWNLSEKQAAWMNAILDEADNIRENGPWLPSAEQVEKLKACIKLGRGYSGTHWNNNPGTYKALKAAAEYLEADGPPPRPWHVNKLLTAMKGKLKELFEVPYVTPEKPCWAIIPTQPGERRVREYGLATVMGPPQVNEAGRIVYPVLTGTGSLALLSRHSLAKRKPR